MPTRILFYLVPEKTGFKAGVWSLCIERPKAKFIGNRNLKIIQRISKEQQKNELWIKSSLRSEAEELFLSFKVRNIIIELEYE